METETDNIQVYPSSGGIVYCPVTESERDESDCVFCDNNNGIRKELGRFYVLCGK